MFRITLIVLSLLVTFCLYAQNFPYPQNVTYDFGYMPTVANTADATNAYNWWKANLTTTQNAGGYQRVIYPQASNFQYTASEGIGYGMLLAVYAADKPLFDDLFNYYKLKVNAQGLMQWRTDFNGNCSGGDCNSATDGDEDIAFALIVAHCQWGSGGAINYLQESINLLNNIMTWEVDLPSGRLRPGEFFGGADCIDPSYFTIAYYPFFEAVTGDVNWGVVRQYCLNYFANYGHPTSGLFRDWSTETGGAPQGSCNWREDDYAYDASRIPWRVGQDYLWHGEITSRDVCRDMVNWTRTAGPVNGNAGNFRDCINWDGSGNCGGNANNPTVGGMSIGAMATDQAINEAWANALYNENLARQDNWFFNYTLRTIYLFIQTGNFWEPKCIGTTVPVELINYTVTGNEHKRVITWQTASEENNDYFLVEKSDDGIAYTTLGLVSAKSQGAIVNTYLFHDYTDLKTTITYYKLSQVDVDGEQQVLGIRTIEKNAQNSLIFETPVHQFDFIIDFDGELVSIEMYDLHGQQKNIAHTINDQHIEVSHQLTPGIYLLKAHFFDEILIKKIIIE